MAFTQTKSMFESLTINASIATFIIAALAVFGIHLSPDAVPDLDRVLTGAAAALAIYGRLRANTFIV